jgi:HK97 family phage portal protein
MERKTQFSIFGIPLFSKVTSFPEAEARSSDGTSTLKNPADWLRNALGIESFTGENITPETAMTIPTFAGCVKILAETVAMLPFKPMRQERDGNTIIDTSHPVYNLLHDRPNPMMNAYVWKETMQTHAGMHGNGYSLILRNADARPNELRLIPRPGDVTPFVFENRLWYKVEGMDRPIPAEDMFHISGLSYNGIEGKKPTELLKNVLGLAIAVEKYGTLIFANGGAQRVAFRSPGKVDPKIKEGIIESFKDKYGGTDKLHEPGFLEGGLELIKIGMDPMSAQFIELKKHLISEIVRPFRVQMHLVQEMSQATNNNIEKQSREFVDYTMMPWLVKWEKEADTKLFSAQEKKDRFTKFNVKSLLRGDFRSQTEGLVKMIQWGIYTPNQALQILDENTYDGGELHMFPQNMTTVEKIQNAKDN